MPNRWAWTSARVCLNACTCHTCVCVSINTAFSLYNGKCMPQDTAALNLLKKQLCVCVYNLDCPKYFKSKRVKQQLRLSPILELFKVLTVTPPDSVEAKYAWSLRTSIGSFLFSFNTTDQIRMYYCSKIFQHFQRHQEHGL